MSALLAEHVNFLNWTDCLIELITLRVATLHGGGHEGFFLYMMIVFLLAGEGKDILDVVALSVVLYLSGVFECISFLFGGIGRNCWVNKGLLINSIVANSHNVSMLTLTLRKVQ